MSADRVGDAGPEAAALRGLGLVGPVVVRLRRRCTFEKVGGGQLFSGVHRGIVKDQLMPSRDRGMRHPRPEQPAAAQQQGRQQRECADQRRRDADGADRTE